MYVEVIASQRQDVFGIQYRSALKERDLEIMQLFCSINYRTENSLISCGSMLSVVVLSQCNQQRCS